MKDFEFKEIGKLGKSISVQEMKGNGNVYFRLTKLYKTDDGEWRPTNKGVSVPAEFCGSLCSMLKTFMDANSDACGGNAGQSDLSADLGELQ